MSRDAQGGSPANRLAHEKSPYLQQHARNPVDWYPWGEEAFAKAREERKPIFLSIGYSTCHWCHVMERESFERPEIAALMNQWFVSIKVDREEHPEVDHLYMSAVTMLTGRGGWPLTVFLTPELKPFFGGTYFPPERRDGMAGMKDLLPAVAHAWASKRDEILESSSRLTESLRQQLSGAADSSSLSSELLDAGFNHAAALFDPSFGGFGEAPKFPRAHELSFLLAYALRTGARQALEMATRTLDRLASGGICDHLGGGFHRYSTDGQWLVPHFEKMLYDQALLARAFLEAYRVTGRESYAETARGIFDYVLRDLTDPAGGFYAAEDADSEGEEGKCYVWTPAQIRQALGAEAGERFCRFYEVTESGNFERGHSILHQDHSVEEFAALQALEPSVLRRQLAEGRAALLAERSRRVRPHRDEKILTSWNGLMIAALAEGGVALGEPAYLEAAERAAEFLLRVLVKDGQVLRRYRDGDARYPGILDDYAFLLLGLLSLYEASFKPRYLGEARAVAEQMVARFHDASPGSGSGGGFWLTDQREAALIVPMKEVYDGATPSGNSVAALGLLRLGRLLADQRFETVARRTIEAFASTVARGPFGYPQMLLAIDLALGPMQEVVIAGDPAAPETKALIRAARRHWLPRAVMALHPAAGPERESIEALVPSIAFQETIRGEPAAYVCEQYTCQAPLTDPERLAERLAPHLLRQDSSP